MVERVTRYKEKASLFEAYGVDAEIKSTLSRRVDLPSGGYLIFDYAEAFTVIDVNTGRFVGSRSKSSGARLEDTITKNNLEAVKEVVRQLRLRDIGGIIVIDFIDMANPKNRHAVEEALRTELERDRTKTYVVEISPLGLVEMTRQNVTEGPREILTRKCPTCGGDGVVISEQTAAIDTERRLRELARGSRMQAFRVELNDRIAALVTGPGASRLSEIESAAKRRFFLEQKPNVHLDHFLVTAQGKLETVAPDGPVQEGASVELQPVEIDLFDPKAAVAKLDGYDVVIAEAAKLVGKKVKAKVERVQPGTLYATLVAGAKAAYNPVTAEGEAEKPTRRPATKKAEAEVAEPLEVHESAGDEDSEGDEETKPKRKTRRGSRGGRKRKKPATPTAAAANGDEPASPTIHVPADDLGREAEAAVESAVDEPSENGTEPAKPKKKTRRGSRGGRNRRKKPAAAPTEARDSS